MNFDRAAERKTARYVTTEANCGVGSWHVLAFFSVVTVTGLSIAYRQKLPFAMFQQAQCQT